MPMILIASALAGLAAAPTSLAPGSLEARSDRSARVPAGHVFTCTPTQVRNGDGPIWCAEGPRIRLAAVAAREIDGSCRPRHPCPLASGTEARAALVELLGGPKGQAQQGHVRVEAPTMTCLSDGGEKDDRTAAWCVTLAGIELNCAMVRSGTALRWAYYDRDNRLSACAPPGRGERG